MAAVFQKAAGPELGGWGHQALPEVLSLGASLGAPRPEGQEDAGSGVRATPPPAGQGPGMHQGPLWAGGGAGPSPGPVGWVTGCPKVSLHPRSQPSWHRLLPQGRGAAALGGIWELGGWIPALRVVRAAACAWTQGREVPGQTARGLGPKTSGQRLSQRKGAGTGPLNLEGSPLWVLSSDVQTRPHHQGEEPRGQDSSGDGLAGDQAWPASGEQGLCPWAQPWFPVSPLGNPPNPRPPARRASLPVRHVPQQAGGRTSPGGRAARGTRAGCSFSWPLSPGWLHGKPFPGCPGSAGSSPALTALAALGSSSGRHGQV